MRTYGKIDTLFERDESFRVMPDRLRRPVLATINKWVVTEKIDGTNIRVDIRPHDGIDKVTFGGRSDNAQISADLIQHLTETFTVDKMAGLRKEPNVPITLFGEGYGAGIQKGGAYRPDKSFILFDVLIADEYWMPDDVVTEFAGRLGIERVPILGEMPLDEIIPLVRGGIKSHFGTAMAEGIVARPLEPLFDRRHERLILKLKTKDFRGGK